MFLANFITAVFEAIPVVDTAIYAVGDVLFNPQVLATLNAPKDNGPLRGEITHVQVLDEDNQAQSFDLVFMRSLQNLGTINLAVSISDANAREIIGIIPVLTTDYKALVGSSQAIPQFQRPLAFEIPFTKGGASPIIYVAAILRSGTPTYTASGLRIRAGINLHNVEQQ